MSRWPASTSPPASRRRCSTASCSTSTSTASAESSTTRISCSATATCTTPSPSEDEKGVWDSAAANMRTYLLLKERAAAFRADPEVQEALAAARVAELSVPTLGEGETYDEFLADRSAYEDFDPNTYFGGKGFGFVRLQQLATEHLLGAR